MGSRPVGLENRFVFARQPNTHHGRTIGWNEGERFFIARACLDHEALRSKSSRRVSNSRCFSRSSAISLRDS